MPINLPKITFPSDIEIYGGKLKIPSGFETNEINVKSLTSTYPMDVNFSMDFKNFIPPTLKDSIKINTVLNKETTFTKVYDLDDYNFINPSNNNKPVNEQTALSELIVDLSAILPSQTARIPLDGSDIGNINLDVELKKLHFETLEANIIQAVSYTHLTLPTIYSV